MSIKLQLTDAKIDVKPADQLNLQYMPVGLAENSPANIDTYFNSYTEEKDGSEYHWRTNRTSSHCTMYIDCVSFAIRQN